MGGGRSVGGVHVTHPPPQFNRPTSSFQSEELKKEMVVQKKVNLLELVISQTELWAGVTTGRPEE